LVGRLVVLVGKSPMTSSSVTYLLAGRFKFLELEKNLVAQNKIPSQPV
jgi:hypothetical protein